MTRSFHGDPEKARQLMAFAESLYESGDPRASRLMDQMRMVSHQLYQLGEASLAETGLSYAQYRVLMSLLFSEWQGSKGLNPSEISEQQGTTRNTISALIRSLEEDGLIERRLDNTDRRRFNIGLTDAGRQLVRRHADRHMQLASDIFSVFTPDEMTALSELLHKLNRCVHSLREQTAPTSGGFHATSR